MRDVWKFRLREKESWIRRRDRGRRYRGGEARLDLISKVLQIIVVS